MANTASASRGRNPHKPTRWARSFAASACARPPSCVRWQGALYERACVRECVCGCKSVCAQPRAETHPRRHRTALYRPRAIKSSLKTSEHEISARTQLRTLAVILGGVTFGQYMRRSGGIWVRGVASALRFLGPNVPTRRSGQASEAYWGYREGGAGPALGRLVAAATRQ